MIAGRVSAAIAMAVLLLAGTVPMASAAVNRELVQGGLTQPIYLTHAGDERLFVIEQDGLIKILDGGSVSTFLDVTDRTNASGERGLLGLAFHPSYASNGLFYVVYTRISDGDVVLAEYKVSSDPDVADPNSHRTVLIIEHSSATNHNGGWIGFRSDLLYMAVGDGGNTPSYAPNIRRVKGKILRLNPLDPDGTGSATFSVPSSNPYVGRAGNDLVLARGLRNPWRCSHDRLTGFLWCGDVGQNEREEINRVKTVKGKHFGWPRLEASRLYPSGDPCTSTCHTLPIAEYTHTENNPSGCSSVTGGYVARRSGAAAYGQYFLADYCTGKIWTIPANHPPGAPLPAPAEDTNMWIASFGEGADGRLYVIDRAGGSVWRLTDT